MPLQPRIPCSNTWSAAPAPHPVETTPSVCGGRSGRVSLYQRAKADPQSLRVPRTFLFGAKAAPGYATAKHIIKLINAVGDTIRNEQVKGLSDFFVPNYRVSLAERLIPACDLSEQISTAGLEASGTGNMKLSLNGALTIGTLDGANVEIREHVGADNFFLFGMTAPEVSALKESGYNPRDRYESNPNLREAIDQIASGVFSRGDRGLFRPLVENLLTCDDYLALADYQAYVDCQERVSALFSDRERWTGMSILNVAGMGKFSSDRSIREYSEKIWGVRPVALPPKVEERPGVVNLHSQETGPTQEK